MPTNLVQNLEPGAVPPEFLERVLSAVSSGWWDWNLDTGAVYVSDEWLARLGYRRDEMRPHIDFLMSLIHPDDLPYVKQALIVHLKGAAPLYECEHRLRRHDGTYRWNVDRGRVVERAADGRAIRIVGADTDASERKTAEQALLAVLHGTWLTHGASFYQSLTRLLAETLEVRYALIASVEGPDFRAARTRAVWAGLEHGDNFEYDLVGTPCQNVLRESVCLYPSEVQRQFPDDQLLVEMGVEGYLGAPIMGSAGRPIGLIAVMHDKPLETIRVAKSILSTFALRAGMELERERADSERAELEDQIRQAEKLKSIGILAGGIAHDFNNLLTGVMGHAELAKERLSEDSPVHAHLDAVVGAARHASGLCGELLTYSGRSESVREYVDLNEEIARVTQFLTLSISKKSQLVFEGEPNVPAILVDPAQLQQVGMNLTTNASESLEGAAGVISITTGTQHCDEAYLSRCSIGAEAFPGEYVFFEVRDTGCGMDEASRAQLFDPFYTTKATGRGLGLASVSGIVRNHGGAVRFESTPGEGTTFRVLFPAAQRQPALADGVPATVDDWRGSGLVLVADDEELVLSYLGLLLEHWGFEVVTAPNGAEAVRRFEEQGDAIRLVLMDLTMPVMDGLEAFHRIRDLRSSVPIILASGYSGEESMPEYRNEVGVDFIHKPFESARLKEKIRILVG